MKYHIAKSKTQKIVMGTALSLLIGVGGTLTYAEAPVDASIISAPVEATIISAPVDATIISAPVNQAPTVISYNDLKIFYDVEPVILDGITYLPLKRTAEAMGFEVTWHAEDQSVELLNGARWTQVTIGNNAYFKNRMAPTPLSAAPIIIEGRTLVPIEFFTEMLDYGMTVENREIDFNDESNGHFSGVIQSIVTDETGSMTLTIGPDLESTDMTDITILHVSNAYSFVQVPLEVGEFINAVTAPYMTMSLPAQTGAYIIY